MTCHGVVTGGQEGGRQNIDYQMKPNAQPARLITMTRVQRPAAMFQFVARDRPQHEAQVEAENNDGRYCSIQQGDLPVSDPSIWFSFSRGRVACLPERGS